VTVATLLATVWPHTPTPVFPEHWSLLPFRLLSFAFIAFAVMGVWLVTWWYGYVGMHDKLMKAKRRSLS
jgi:hypothetical protein